MIKIKLPEEVNKIENLRAGDRLSLSGKIYVARDQAHKRLVESIEKEDNLPFDLKDSFIYYMGPSPTPQGEVIGSCGPTTSHRMDKYSPLLLKKGVKGMIGKGRRSQEVLNSIKENKAVYLSATGGAGALLQQKINKAKIIAYEDLGPEAILELEVENFPVIVTIDSNGTELFKEQQALYEGKWKKE